jgi:hypothetical protein
MATFVVTTSRDVANGDLSENDLSLREAITLTNARAGADRIMFAEDIDEVKLRDALPRISDDLKLVGGGHATLDANADSRNGDFRRALDIGGPSREISVTLDGLTVTGGHTDYTFSKGGGGIRAGAAVNLRIVDCTIEGNQSYGDGGGRYSCRGRS